MLHISMARSLQVLSLFSRFGALSVIPPVSANIRRFASRVGGRKAWMDQDRVHRETASTRDGDMDDMSDELEDVEDRLEALMDEGRKRQRTLKYHILRREMTPKGAPQRKLTWDAMEQIRFLKQELPEEWTVERLAEGFSVTPDVIFRVLRSKFVPSPERRAKQNAKVMAELGQQVLPSGTQRGMQKLPRNLTPAMLASGNTEAALVPVASQTQVIRDEGSASLAKSPVSVPVLPGQLTAGISKQATVTSSTVDSDIGTNAGPTVEDEEDEDSWDGRVWTEEELEEFMEMEKPSPVRQVGCEFFDSEGKFLYRI
ncbi:neugrin [Mugil cephalus]|uniref:neugrin n=1 Tax=Mugil cephalus TaxID=48193 RepID=UPI001FB6434C|nr:neugrin [Mugil cephalus]